MLINAKLNGYPISNSLSGRVGCQVDLETGSIAVVPAAGATCVDHRVAGELAHIEIFGVRFDAIGEGSLRVDPGQLQGLVDLAEQSCHQLALERRIELAQQALRELQAPLSYGVSHALVTATVNKDGSVTYGQELCGGDNDKARLPLWSTIRYPDGASRILAKVKRDGEVERFDFDERFTNPVDLKPNDVPADIRAFTERFCAFSGVGRGACDPMYVANLVAMELGRGDGCSNFYSTPLPASGAPGQATAWVMPDGVKQIDAELADKIAKRLAFCYSTCLIEASGLPPDAACAVVAKLLQKNIGIAQDAKLVMWRPELASQTTAPRG